jgi:hypothetical protein
MIRSKSNGAGRDGARSVRHACACRTLHGPDLSGDLAVEKLLAAAANGAPAPQPSFATMHRQPTPATIASAEQKAGDLSSAQVDAITGKLDAARAADDRGERATCEQGLNEVDRMLRH